MQKSIIITLIVLSSITNNLIAGVYSLTHHSRANCVNNETISWELGRSHLLQTVSVHHHYGSRGLDRGHTIIRGFEMTWRSAAVCYREGFEGGWKVWGGHFTKVNGIKTRLASTFTENCSIYNGWWDY